MSANIALGFGRHTVFLGSRYWLDDAVRGWQRWQHASAPERFEAFRSLRRLRVGDYLPEVQP